MQPLFLKCILILSLIASCPYLAQSDELFICKNISLEEPIITQKVDNIKSKTSNSFRPGDRITAIYYFQPTGDEDFVKFRWMRCLGGRRFEEKSHMHHMRNISTETNYVAFSWLIFDSSFFDQILGSKFAGDWVVEVYINNEKLKEGEFIIKPD